MSSPPPLIEMDICESTQDEARAILSRDPHVNCVAVRTERQTRGRGRQDRKWLDAQGNLFLSLGFRIDPSLVRPWPFVSLLAGMAAARCLARAKCWDEACFVKWPNDLYRARGAKHTKLGGILTELRRDLLLVGIGINVTTAPQIQDTDYDSSCLKDIHSHPPSAATLARDLTNELKLLIETWIASPELTGDAAVLELSTSWMKLFFSIPGSFEGFGPARATRLLNDGRLAIESLMPPKTERLLSSGEFLIV